MTRTVAQQAPESMGFPRQEYWSGLPFPAPGILLQPETEPHISLVSCIASGFFTNEPPEKPNCYMAYIKKQVKLWYIYTMAYYSAIKKNTFKSVLMRWMKLELIIQSEVSQKEKYQYSILTHIYGI